MVAIVTCMFNYNGWQSRYVNYERFAESVKTTGAILYCAELCFNGKQPVCEADVKINIAGDESNVLWQKEALLNIGIQQAVDDGHDIIAYFDADALIPFDFVYVANMFVEPETMHHCAIAWERMWPRRKTPENWPSICRRGGVFYGGGWVAGRDVWSKFHLFDLCVLGSGDWANFAGAYYARYKAWRPCPWTGQPLQIRSVKEAWYSWANTLPKLKHTTALPLAIRLQSHGHRKDRGYLARNRILTRLNHDPRVDLSRCDSGILRWENKGLNDEAIRYFAKRNEDAK